MKESSEYLWPREFPASDCITLTIHRHRDGTTTRHESYQIAMEFTDNDDQAREILADSSKLAGAK
ncbi:hypothetical protein [Ferroacidibacillus organovorans]|uniref:Uncharacterized protein n=1 Tax=Ferroacidibacillus organovorans TaxID=1765683 RepID=A0A853KCR7_9BACL|nr:hypothetical protein [Ferroacidibacillus organovorans]KYP81657.1 hypothetical protein AYJ22_06420 [Ferroacidibacillus organovorans]OAG94144.1 hypothetical protein AYW79_06900 [Ferroacidibacillus organovorans]